MAPPASCRACRWAACACGPGSNLRPRPLGLTAEQEPGLREAGQTRTAPRTNPTPTAAARSELWQLGNLAGQSPGPSGDPAEKPGPREARWPTSRRNPTLATAARSWTARSLIGLLAELASATRSAFDRLSPRVRDHDQIDLDRFPADPRGIGHHRCEPGQHKASDQIMREAMGEHQAFGDAARNVGKQSQCAALVACHASALM